MSGPTTGYTGRRLTGIPSVPCEFSGKLHSAVLSSPLVPPSAEEIRLARLTVADNSHDPHDTAELILALGLANDDQIKPDYLPETTR